MIHHTSRLVGLHDDLITFVKALSEKYQDNDLFIVQGVRTRAQQLVYLQTGASTTLNSRHIPSGNPPLAHAVDIAFVVDGKYEGDDWALYWALADSARTVSVETKIPIIWGAIWDTEIASLEGDPEDAYYAYVKRWKEANPRSIRKGPLADGPHFQLPISSYP